MKLLLRTVTFVVALLLAACNMPLAQPTPGLTVNEQAGTIVAATMRAAASSTSPAITPFASPVAPSVTPTVKPKLSIHTDNSACRSGPGTDFKVIATFPAGTTVDMAGKDTADSYWIVVDPTSHNLCWVQAQDATPSGSFDALPEMTPQPVKVSVPNKPGKGSWNFFCDDTTLTTILAWSAPSGTVNGYRIYRADAQIADVPSSQTSYTEKIPFTYGSGMTYAVAAYNDAGTSPQTVWNFRCPP